MAAGTAADDTADTADDIDDIDDLPPDSAARLFCPFVYVQHLYNPMQWEVAVSLTKHGCYCCSTKYLAPVLIN